MREVEARAAYWRAQSAFLEARPGVEEERARKRLDEAWAVLRAARGDGTAPGVA